MREKAFNAIVFLLHPYRQILYIIIASLLELRFIKNANMIWDDFLLIILGLLGVFSAYICYKNKVFKIIVIIIFAVMFLEGAQGLIDSFKTNKNPVNHHEHLDTGFLSAPFLDISDDFDLETTEGDEAEETLPDISTNEDTVTAENIVEDNQLAPVEEENTLMDIDANTMVADVNGEEYVFYVTEANLNSYANMVISYEASNPRGDRQYRIELVFAQDIKPGEYKMYQVGMTFYSGYYEKYDEYQWNRKHYINYDSESVENSVLLSYRDDKWEHYQGAFSVEFDDGYVIENAVFDFRLNDEYETAENSEDSDNVSVDLQDLIKNFQ